jgi:cysteine synthase
MRPTTTPPQGILTGISGGATMWAAIETAKNAPEGSVILAMLPDTGERYLSTPLFADIAADMNEEELEITKTTPNFQVSELRHANPANQPDPT